MGERRGGLDGQSGFEKGFRAVRGQDDIVNPYGLDHHVDRGAAGFDGLDEPVAPVRESRGDEKLPNFAALCADFIPRLVAFRPDGPRLVERRQVDESE